MIVAHLRQTTQYTCCATSIASALHALGKPVSEDDVNKVLGASPMAGATWEAMLATVQYFGCRGTLVVPATPRMLKTWTDAGIPVVIAWNPEGRPWSHASTVFDVQEGPDGKLTVYVMDPNIPNPSETVRAMDEDTFCQKWSEKVSDSLIVRRPAMAVEREVSVTGRQVVASLRDASTQRYCAIYRAQGGGWYLELADFDGNEREDATTYGPFSSEGAIYDYLQENQSRFGGVDDVDSSARRPVPMKSPNDRDVVYPRGRRRLARFKRVGPRMVVLSQDLDGSYRVTIGDPDKPSSRILQESLSIHGLQTWVNTRVFGDPPKVSEDQVVDLTGRHLVSEHTGVEMSLTDMMHNRAGDDMSIRDMAARVSAAYVEAKGVQEVGPKKKDPNKFVVEGPSRRDGPERVTQRRPGGPMHTRTKNVERGIDRPKHRRPYTDDD